ncbi:non-hydrolyzing UDP-N-acetylglucosamine 2-epimerase [Endozoicomonas sp. 2B-B]
MVQKKILCIVGTRPEAIKMAPVILALKNQNWVKVRILCTAQHRHIMDQVLNLFDITAHIDLNLMRPNQSLHQLTADLITSIDKVLLNEKPDAVLLQGDTTTVMSSAIACFYHHIPIGHIEAGLRTWDMSSPFPEEINRVITARLARWHFSPTLSSRNNLIKEGISDRNIVVTGNTVIDALLMISKKKPKHQIRLNEKKRLILITSHRREHFGLPFSNICRALIILAQNNPFIELLYPVHPNPNIKENAYKHLASVSNIILCEPLDYASFVAVMMQSYIVMTDSGGIQEEAPALGKPVLVMRNKTERPEAIEAGVVKLVGCDYELIVSEAQKLLDNEQAYKSMAKGTSPYGDGRASERIVNTLKSELA